MYDLIDGPSAMARPLTPRPKAIAQREHVRIGADTGIPEEVPRSAHRLAAFEDRVRTRRGRRSRR